MIRITFILIMLLISHSVFPSMTVTGIMCGMKLTAAVNDLAYMYPDRYSFPLKDYKGDGFFICNLKYTDSTPAKERKLDLKIYRTIIAKANLNLISYDKKTGIFKYNISLHPYNINNDVVDGIHKYTGIKGKLIFDENQSYLPIAGKFESRNGRNSLLSLLNKNADYFSIAFISEKSYNILLTRLKNLPVTVEFELDEAKRTV